MASKYTKDVCFEIAKKCATSSDFKRKKPSAYVAARRNGWLSDYTWFVNGKKKPKKFTFKLCEIAAKKCSSLKEFYTLHYPEWMASKRNGWLDSFDWLKRAHHKEWDYESCREVALKFTTKRDFQKAASGAYSVARDKGWLDKDFTWLIDNRVNLEFGRIYSVYRYVFLLGEKKYVYIGLTMRPKDRDHRHREGDSAVYSFAKENNLEFPEMEIIERRLTQLEAREKEDFFRRLYAGSSEYVVLNKAKTGKLIGSVGGMHRKWSRKACLVEARKYRTLADFAKGNMGAYLAATRHKWQKDYTWFKNGRKVAADKRRKYTKETCEKLAHEFSSLKEFRLANASAYAVAKKNNWLSEYNWLFKKPQEVEEREREVVRLYRAGKTAKAVAKIVELSPAQVKLVIQKRIPTEYRGKRSYLVDETKLVSEIDTWKGNKTEFALVHGLPSLDSLNLLLKRLKIVWPKKLKEVSIKPNKKESEHKWDKMRCLAEARKYSTKSSFKAGCSYAYRLSREQGWLAECVWFVNGKKKPHIWDGESCFVEAKKYRLISEFAHKSLGAYKSALKNGWLKNYTWFKHRNTRPNVAASKFAVK